MDLVYDVAHNIAKFEEHDDRRPEEASLGAPQRGDAGLSRPTIPKCPRMYRGIGQPVIIPGDMGRASWVLVGQSGQHGADVRHRLPRRRPRDEPHRRRQARPGPPHRRGAGRKGVIARARSWKGLAEEQPDAYKDVDLVVEVVHRADLARKVARMRPIGVVKG